MTLQIPTLRLSDLSLTQNDNSQMAFSAAGQPILIDPISGAESPLNGLSSFTVGVGQGVSVPQPIQDAFHSDGFAFAAADFGLWLTNVHDAIDPAEPNTALAGEPAWFGSFTSGGIDLFGIHTLPDNVLQLEGLSFGRLELRVALQTQGSAVTRALFTIAGSVEINGSLANLTFDGLTADCGLAMSIVNVAELGTLLQEPASVLDAAFTGQLRFAAAAQKLALGDYFIIENPNCSFDLAVHSPANERTLHLGDVNFGLQANEISIVGAQIQDLDLACGYHAQTERLFMRGGAALSLPDPFDSLLADGSNGGSYLRGSFDFEHIAVADGRLTTLNVGVDALTLAPSINFLELSGRDMEVTFSYLDKSSSDDLWTLSLQGVGCQSWSQLSARLATEGILQLPHAANLPDIQGALNITLMDNASSGQLTAQLDFLQPGTGCLADRDPIPFDNTLGPLPLRLADSFLSLSLTYTQSQLSCWEIKGTGLLSTSSWLRDLITLDRLTFEASASGSGAGLPNAEFMIGAGLPALRLPPLIPGTPAIEIFQLQSLALRLGETLSIEGEAQLPDTLNLTEALSLDLDWMVWDDIMAEIGKAISGLKAKLAIEVPLTESDAAARLSIALELFDPENIPPEGIPASVPEFRLMEALSTVVNAVERSTTEASEHEPKMDSSESEFFIVRPHKIEFEVAAGGDSGFELTLAFSFWCSLFGETFDVVTAFRFVDGQPECLLMAGLADPIRVVIPGIDAEQVLGQTNLSKIVADYHLGDYLDKLDVALFPNAQPTDALATLEDLEERLRTLFASPGMNNSLIFEIRDFGLRVRLDRAPSVSGTVRLVQMPGILDAIMPENGFDFGLGCSVDRIFISVKGPATRSESGLFEPHETAPLLSIPLGQNDDAEDQFLDLFFGRFELEYGWVTNAFGFVFDAAVVPKPDSLAGLQVSGNGVYFPGQSTFVKISKPISTGQYPIVIPEWAFNFDRAASATVDVENAADEMGLQIYLGIPGKRLLTVFFKEFTFSPTYYLMQPGVAIDGGVIIGSHQPTAFACPDGEECRNAYFKWLVGGGDDDTSQGLSNEFLLHYEIAQGVALLMPSPLGVMLNPLTLIPPYFHPMPPFWLMPPYYMGDIYCDSLSMSVNIPHLLFFGIQFSRPLPSLSLQGMMELAALVMSGFAETIPDDSELRQVMYATLEINAKLPLIELIAGTNGVDDSPPLPELNLFFEANVVDIVNGIIRTTHAVQHAIEGSIDIVDSLTDDPNALVRMIPPAARHFAFPPDNAPSATYELLGLTFSGSLYVLTPEEFEAELRLYHEGKRIQPKGLAASQPNPPIVVGATTGAAPLTVQFSLPPIDSGASIVTILWTFDDNSTSSQPNPIHTFVEPGQYAVSLTLVTQITVGTEVEETTEKRCQTIVVEGVPIHQTLVLNATITHALRYIGNPLQYFTTDATAYRNYLWLYSQELFRVAREGRLEPAAFEQKRRGTLDEWLRNIWKFLASTPINKPESRQTFWHRANLTEISDRFEQILKDVAGGTDPSKSIGALPNQAQQRLSNAFMVLARQVLQRYTLIDGPTQSELALQIVRAVVRSRVVNTSGRPSRPYPLPVRPRADAYKITVIPTDKRQDVYRKLLRGANVAPIIKGIETCLKPAIDAADGGKILNRHDLNALRNLLVTCITAHLPSPTGKRIDSLDELPIFQLDQAACFDLLVADVAIPPQWVMKTQTVDIFNGGLTQQWFANTLTLPMPTADQETIDQMMGYEIRSQPNGSDQTFSLPVAHAAPIYRVQFYAGRYQLLLFDGTDVVEVHELPDWFVNDSELAETPQKVDLLRARLSVAERIVPRQRTSAEAAWANQVTSVEDSYQSSIFARPEYVIKPDGGIHGSMSIADLLRNGNDYVVPPGPALLAGFVVNVWDKFELKLAGLISPPNSLFLNGYAKLELQLGAYVLELEGDFRLIAGELWAEVLADNDGFSANQLNFRGSAIFRQNGQTKFRGVASGIIGTDTPNLDIQIGVEYHDSWTLAVADVPLFKVMIDSEIELRVTRDGTQFKINADGDLDLDVRVPDLDDPNNLVEVEIVPAVTACSQVPILPPPLPDGPFFTTECITTPAVTVMMPDLENLSWTTAVDIDVEADLRFDVKNSGLTITLALEIDGQPHSLSLSNLLNE